MILFSGGKESEMFDDILLMVDLVEYGSFYSLANQLKISQSTISRKIHNLESELGVKLINRNTKHFELTQAGRILYENFKTSKVSWQNQLNRIYDQDNLVHGDLKIAMPQSFSSYAITPYLCKFLQDNPKLNLNISYQYNQINLYEEKFDIAITAFIPEQTSVRLKTIYRSKIILVCSREYIEKYGHPDRAEDLTNGRHLVVGGLDQKNSYIKYFCMFREEGDEIVELPNDTLRIRVNNFDQALFMAASGECICGCPIDRIQSKLDSGEFVRLFPEYNLGYLTYYLIRSLDAGDMRYQIFSDFIMECMGKLADYEKTGINNFYP